MFKDLIIEFHAKLAAWVVLANHYHFLFLPRSGFELGNFMKRLNGRTSRELNLLDDTKGRTIWYTYWDTCIRGERDFWTRFNYIHYNPVKHGYVERPKDWRYSSYRYYADPDGSLWLDGCFRDFPAERLFEDDQF